jgi:hypothetical protein
MSRVDHGLSVHDEVQSRIQKFLLWIGRRFHLYSDRRKANDIVGAGCDPDLGHIQILNDLAAHSVLEPADVMIRAKEAH